MLLDESPGTTGAIPTRTIRLTLSANRQKSLRQSINLLERGRVQLQEALNLEIKTSEDLSAAPQKSDDEDELLISGFKRERRGKAIIQVPSQSINDDGMQTCSMVMVYINMSLAVIMKLASELVHS